MSETKPLAEDLVRSAFVETLGVDAGRAAVFSADTPLFGALPELDSMAVATLLTDLEDRIGILIDDDEVDAELFETFGNLVRFVERKRASR